MNLRPYIYSLYQYVPDVVRQERVNLGVVVVSDEERDARCAFLPEVMSKVSFLNPNANGEVINRIVESFKQGVGAAGPPNESSVDEQRIVSSRRLALLSEIKANQFQLSQPKGYHAASLQAAVDELYAALVAPIEKKESAQARVEAGALAGAASKRP